MVPEEGISMQNKILHSRDSGISARSTASNGSSLRPPPFNIWGCATSPACTFFMLQCVHWASSKAESGQMYSSLNYLKLCFVYEIMLGFHCVNPVDRGGVQKCFKILSLVFWLYFFWTAVHWYPGAKPFVSSSAVNPASSLGFWSLAKNLADAGPGMKDVSHPHFCHQCLAICVTKNHVDLYSSCWVIPFHTSVIRIFILIIYIHRYEDVCKYAIRMSCSRFSWAW